MKVILLQDIEKIGKKYDIKDVSNGFARNFLLPQGLAKIADEDNLEWAKAQMDSKEEKAKTELEQTGDMVNQLDGYEIEIPVKVGDKGQLFEKVSSKKITEALQAQGFKVKNNQIELENDIHEAGEFDVKIKFEHNLETQIKVIITEE